MPLAGANYGRRNGIVRGDLGEMSGRCHQTANDIAVKNMSKTQVNPATLLNVALSMLPLHAEEERQRDSLPEAELVASLIAQGGAEQETVLSLVYTLRRQFEALCLLDPLELRSGKWAFVSFPASLLARSWLMTLATPGQALLPADYWEQEDARPPETKEEQRSLLHRIEAGRLRLNPRAKTIRTVHVAAALIRLGDKFLLHHREDKKRPGEKNYVLTGGRFKLSDLPIEIQDRQKLLVEISNPDSEIVAQHISRTLEREVEEETKLLSGAHYSYEAFDTLVPVYREVNGPENRHAYTAYKFFLFQIKLTQAGETRLLDNVSASSGKLTWFSIADIVSPQRADGASAYVDALRWAWGDELEKQLLNVPDSSATPLSYRGESCMLDLPWHSGGNFYLGKPGKERPLTPTSTLHQEEWHLLVLLGWHMRGFPISEVNGIRLLENGWIDAHNIMPLVRSLQKKIPAKLPNLIEIREDCYASLRISPDCLFFPVEVFRYNISGSNKEGGRFRLERQEVHTSWGCLLGHCYEKDITGKTTTTLRELEKGDEPGGDWERNLREQFGEGIRGLGLRRLWSNKGNSSCLVLGLRRTQEL